MAPAETGLSERLRFSPGSVRYDRALAAGYQMGRALSLDALDVWQTAVEPFAPRAA